ncbi:MAG: hypothetical protein ABFD18_02855 [Syntrophomonas sp.]
MIEIKLILRYITLMFNNWVLNTIFILDIIGLFLSYNINVQVPKWFLYTILQIAFLCGGYSIFRKSSPNITVEAPNKDDINFVFSGGHLDLTQIFTINMKSYFSNYGLQTGSLEYIKVTWVGLNNISDSYVLKNFVIKIGEIYVCNKQPTPLLIMKQPEFEFKYPVIIGINTLKPFYIQTDLSFNTYEQEDIDKAIEWLNVINFEIEYKVKDSFGVNSKKSPLNVYTESLFKCKEEAQEHQKGMKAWISDY